MRTRATGILTASVLVAGLGLAIPTLADPSDAGAVNGPAPESSGLTTLPGRIDEDLVSLRERLSHFTAESLDAPNPQAPSGGCVRPAVVRLTAGDDGERIHPGDLPRIEF